MSGLREGRRPVDDLRNVFIGKREEGSYEASDQGDEFGIITASAMLSGNFPVVRVDDVTPRMRRITLHGDGLAPLRGQWEPGWDVRALFPPEGLSLGPAGPLVFEGVKPAVRTYTVRSFDDDALELSIDIALHDHDGKGSGWARRANRGDLLGIAVRYPEASPRDHEADCYVLVGDETAIPAIGSIIETLPAGSRGIAFLEVYDDTDEQTFHTDADVALTWLHRGSAAAGTTKLLEDAVRRLEWPEGKVFAWVTGEVRMASAIRQFLREERGYTRHDYKIQAYWRRGMTEAERLDRVKENIAPLVAAGTDPIEIYSERGMAAADPTLND